MQLTDILKKSGLKPDEIVNDIYQKIDLPPIIQRQNFYNSSNF